MRLARLTTALGAILLATVASAQTPNFTGKWTLVPNPAATGPGGGLGQEATITQDASSITIKRTTQMGEFTTTYKLDDVNQAYRLGANSYVTKPTDLDEFRDILGTLCAHWLRHSKRPELN